MSDPKWSTIHEPRIDDPTESVLAAANIRGRDAAIRLLSSLLPGLPLDHLSQTTDSATFHVSQATGELQSLLDPVVLLDDLFSWRGLHGRQLMLVRENEYIPVDALLAPLGPGGRPRVKTSELFALMQDGFTVVLNGIELRDPISMRLTEAFERVFGCAVNINGYLSLRPSMSFGAHWDDQETVILQLLGPKDWLLEEPLDLSMHKLVHGPATSERTVWEGTLEPGAALYVPRGWGHRVRSVEKLTYHYTVTIPRTNGTGILRRVLERKEPQALPLSSLPIVRGQQSFNRLAPSLTDSEVRSAVASIRIQMLSRSTQRLSEAVAATSSRHNDMWVRFACPGGWLVQECTKSHAVVGTAGRQFSVATSVLPDVAFWCDGLARRWPRDSPTQTVIVSRLIRLGLLDVFSGPPDWGQPVADDQ